MGKAIGGDVSAPCLAPAAWAFVEDHLYLWAFDLGEVAEGEIIISRIGAIETFEAWEILGDQERAEGSGRGWELAGEVLGVGGECGVHSCQVSGGSLALCGILGSGKDGAGDAEVETDGGTEKNKGRDKLDSDGDFGRGLGGESWHERHERRGRVRR